MNETNKLHFTARQMNEWMKHTQTSFHYSLFHFQKVNEWMNGKKHKLLSHSTVKKKKGKQMNEWMNDTNKLLSQHSKVVK